MSFSAQFDCNEVRELRGSVYPSSDRPTLPGSKPLPTCYFVTLEVPGGTVTLVADHSPADFRRLAEELRAAADQLDADHGAQDHYARALAWQPEPAA
jgi:hypothetical protein